MAARITRTRRSTAPHEVDSNLVKAMAHPLRMRILTRLNEKVASPNELAKEFGVALPALSYHVRILRELECIELVRTVPRRGALEHFYRATQRRYLQDEQWAQLPESARQALSGTILERAFGDVRSALLAETFDAREDRHLSYAPLVLDEQGWTELTERLAELLEWALDEQARAAGRLQDEASGGEEIAARLTMLCYPAPPPGAAGEPPGA
jgi:DNA-binding transcriptional ArsR family regulator